MNVLNNWKNTLSKLSINQAVLEAKSLSREGNIKEARRIYEAILRVFPKNKIAQRGLSELGEGKGISNCKYPPQNVIDDLISLFNSGDLLLVVRHSKAALREYPDSDVLWNILGAASKGLGLLEDACNSFIEATKINPQYAEGFNNLGTTLKSQGELDQAIEAFKKSIRINSKNPDAHYNMGNALREKGDLGGALKSFKESLSLRPNNPEAYNNMGNLLKAQGKIDEAIESYRKAVDLKPDYLDAYNNMGNALKNGGKLDEALVSYNKALLANPNTPEFHYNVGHISRSLGKLDEAITCYRKAVSLRPDYVAAHNDMGYALKETGDLSGALASFKKVLSLRPGNVKAYLGIGHILEDQDALDDAIACYQKIISLDPDYLPAYTSMGRVYRVQDRLDDAIEYFTKAVSMHPDNSKLYLTLGAALKDKGNIDTAIKHLNQSLSLDPHCARTHRLLATLTKCQVDDGKINFLSGILRRSDLTDEDRSHLNSAIGKMYQDVGEFQRAFHHYVDAGKFKNRADGYNFSREVELFTSLNQNANNISCYDFNVQDSNSFTRPIFIVGMPRSGTTLVEQIISCHSQVQAAGELPFLANLAMPIARGEVPLNNEELLKIRNSYLNRISRISNGSRFITDKMPHNFRFTCLIEKVFPEAKIIHVIRDPSATCWSNFSHYFPAIGLGYSNDINDTVQYYKMYRGLMNNFQNLCPDKLYTLDYEKLTIDQEEETRELIKYLELDWEDACLSPHENTRTAHTASQQQVRKKVYKGSAETWRKFEPFINGVFDDL